VLVWGWRRVLRLCSLSSWEAVLSGLLARGEACVGGEEVAVAFRYQDSWICICDVDVILDNNPGVFVVGGGGGIRVWILP
jgi:hypothetical protein